MVTVKIGPCDADASEDGLVAVLPLPLRLLLLSQDLVDEYASVWAQIMPRSAIGDFLDRLHWEQRGLVGELLLLHFGFHYLLHFAGFVISRGILVCWVSMRFTYR